MKIAIIGAGAMGSLFGGLLSDVSEVCLYSRNIEYVEEVNKNGLIMTQGKKRFVKKIKATNNPLEIGESDVAIIFVKSTGTEKAMQDALVSSITPETLVVTLQNGIGNAEIINKFVPKRQIAYGFTTFTSDKVAPGHIEMTTLKKVGTYLAPMDDECLPKLEKLVNLMNKVGLNAEIPDDIDEKIWYKIMVNASENALCAILKINVSDLMINTPESYEIAKQIIFEVSDVARAKGINISRQSALEHVMNVTYSVPKHVPSMVFDIVNKKKTEISSLNEEVVKEGKRLGIDTPVNEIIVKIIRAMEKNYDNLIVDYKIRDSKL